VLPGIALASYFYGFAAGIAALGLGLTVGPFAYFVKAARRMSLLGFAHSDLEPAFKAAIEQAHEEHAAEHGLGPSRVEQLARTVARVSWPITLLSGAGTLLAMLFREQNDWTAILAVDFFLNILIVSNPISFTSSALYLLLLERRRDVATDLWARIWTGRIGRLAFALGRKLLGNRVLGSAMTHRATELSLGMAAENLYGSLPKEMRSALGDLPDLLRRLQGDAQMLRKRHDDLQEVLAEAGDAGSSDAYDDLRADRDAVHAKLGDAVGALETIRLNLLRLHAGSGTVEGLTTHIGLAAEVSAEVERMLAAQEEVEQGLAFPRETATTPV
jgi:hypothetical protein